MSILNYMKAVVKTLNKFAENNLWSKESKKNFLKMFSRVNSEPNGGNMLCAPWPQGTLKISLQSLALIFFFQRCFPVPANKYMLKVNRSLNIYLF